MLDRTIGQDANIQRIAITFDGSPGSLRRESSHLVSAKGLGNEAIESGTDIRVLLGAIDLEIPCNLVDLVFQSVGGNHFDETLHDFRHMFAWRDSMPRMRLEQDPEEFP